MSIGNGAEVVESRVCPDCGSPAGGHAFCESCGLNLSRVQRFPTRTEWQRATEARLNLEAHAVASAIESLERLTPLPPPAGSIVQTASDSISRAVVAALGSRPAANAVTVDLDSPGGVPMGARVRVVVGEGTTVEQRFRIDRRADSARLTIGRDGPVELVSGTFRHDLTTTPLDSPQPPAPVAVTTQGLTAAVAAELEARRQADARLHARLTGWKPLTCWYATWTGILAIGGVVGLADGQVGVFLIALVLGAASAKYAHYLYHGGRRRVWLGFW
jgi:hypothetical protein